MSEYEWERDNALHAKAKCKYCGELFTICYSMYDDVPHIPDYYWCLCDECKKRVINKIPKRYKIKGAWRDFMTYADDYKINQYRI